MLPREFKKKPIKRRRFWIIFAVVAVFVVLGLWLRPYFYQSTPRLNYIMMAVNGQLQKVLPGENISLHPRDKLKIVEISTTLPLDFGIRLTSTSIDVDGLRYGEMPISELLPGEDIFNHFKLRVQVKHKIDVIGYMDWEIRPYLEDWLEKADRIIDKERRLELLRRAVRLTPDEKKLRRRLIDEYRSQGKWKEAALLLEKIFKEKSDADVLEELLEIYQKGKDKAGVSSVLKRQVDSNPENIEARIRLADHFEKRGRLKEAAEQYEVIQKYVEDEQALGVYTRLGYLYAEMGVIDEAIRAYKKAVELDNKDANIYYNISYLYEKAGEKEKADEYLAKAIEIKTDDVKGRMKLAKGLVEKDIDKAEGYVQQVLENKPDSMEALLLLAAIKDKRGEKTELRGVYRKILSLDSDNKTVLYNLAALEYDLGNVDASLLHFKKYLTFHPEDKEVHEVLFDIYKEQGKQALAYEQAKILVDLNPKDMGPYRYIFEYLSSKSKYEEIIKIAKEGLNENPAETELMEYLVAAYLKTGKEDLALNQMEEIVKERPKDIPLLLRLAKFRESRGDLKEALKAYKTIIELSPGHEEAEEAYLRLRLKGVRDKD
ncbi:tetratricopeptide repeat protein [Thermodesulfobacteriota bacterium]